MLWSPSSAGRTLLTAELRELAFQAVDHRNATQCVFGLAQLAEVGASRGQAQAAAATVAPAASKEAPSEVAIQGRLPTGTPAVADRLRFKQLGEHIAREWCLPAFERRTQTFFP